MNKLTQEFIETIRSHLDELENATSQLDDAEADSINRALDAARNAFAVIEGFLQMPAQR